MSLIAIDPGLKTSNTGVAVFQRGKLVYNGIYQVQEIPWRDNMHELIRYLKAFVKRDDQVVVEKSFYPGKANIMHLKTIGVFDYYYDIDTIAPCSVKKIVTGSGRADKQEVKNAVIKKLSEKELKIVKLEDEDAVDAIAIGLAYLHKLREVNNANR